MVVSVHQCAKAHCAACHHSGRLLRFPMKKILEIGNNQQFWFILAMIFMTLDLKLE
jgi:hypothetical protein